MGSPRTSSCRKPGTRYSWSRPIGSRRACLLVHGLLAVSGLALWLVYALTESGPFVWLAVAFLEVVAAVGVSLFRALASRQSRPGSY